MKKRIELKNALLVVTELWDGRLVLGELEYGESKKAEMRVALAKAGYNFGIIDTSLEMLQNGQKGQMPIALAFLNEDPGKPWFHFEDALNTANFDEWLRTGNIATVDFTYPVKKDERLLTLSESPFQYLRYPNGKIERLDNNTARTEISLFSGENTTVNETNNAILATCDGVANRTIYGRVSVYPVKTIKNIGKMHGKVEFDSALEVEQDIRSESHVTIPSNITVNGLVRSAYLRVGGNIMCEYGLDNMNKVDMARIYAGQSIYSNQILHYKVWAGMFIIIRKSIEMSDIQCMHSIVAPLIRGSEVRVGSKLFARNIDKGSQIYLGPTYVIDPSLKAISNYHRQHEKKIFDLNLDIESQQRELAFTKKKALTHLGKLNKMAKSNIASDMLLHRFYANMQKALEGYNESVNLYEETVSSYDDEHKQLAFYETHNGGNKDSEIIITGKIGTGCVIHAPNESYRIRETMSKLSIKLKPESGTLDIKPL